MYIYGVAVATQMRTPPYVYRYVGVYACVHVCLLLYVCV